MMKFKLLEILNTTEPCEMCAEGEYDGHDSGIEIAKYKVRFYGLQLYGKRRSAVAKICDTCFSKFKKLYSDNKLPENQYAELLGETDDFLAELEERVRGMR
jgi:hypothetical protein